MATQSPLVLLSETKHPAGEREVRSVSDEAPRAVPGSFAPLGMTESPSKAFT